MRVNNYSGISIFATLVLLAIGIAGCDSVSFPASSVSGVLSVPVTGEQHYEENETASDFGNDFDGAKDIEYEDTAHGTIDASDVDYFQFTGDTGDSVIIDIDAEAIGSGLDSRLYLYDPGRNEKYINDDYPIGWQDDPANYIFVYDSHIEITLDTSGMHFIKVEGYGTTSGSYRLNLFQTDSDIATAGAETSPSNAEFVPNEIILKYIPGFDPASVKAAAPAGYRPVKTGRDTSSGVLSLFRLEEDAASSKGFTSARERTLAEAARLNRLPYVEYAEPNYIMRPTFIPDDTYYSFEKLQWHYPVIRLDQVWEEDLMNDVSGVRVAVIDTGIGRTTAGDDHPDLVGIFADEYDFITDPSNALDGDGIDDDATDIGDDPNGRFSSFHGTHVIGTIGAVTDNGTGIAAVSGGEGIGKGVTIIPLRAVGAQGGNVYDISQAVRYAAGLPNDSGEVPSPKADIINMSLGGTVNSQTLRDAVNAAYGAGVLLVASAGNEGSSIPFYPAAYENVVSVSAVGPGGDLAPYSSFGTTVEIAAPGGDTSTDLTFDVYPDGVLSTLFDQEGSSYSSTYSFYQGTSMAAPHVSGVAALMLAANGDLTPSAVRSTLASSAIDLGQSGRDIYYGHGLVNAYAAVMSALGGEQNPVLYPFPRSVKLEGTGDPAGYFTLKNIGGDGTVTINGIVEADDPEGLVASIDPDGGEDFTVDDAGVDITVTLSTSGLEDGKTHQARLEITYDSSKKEYVYVLYNRDGISSFSENEDVGYIFVVAIDPASSQTVAQDITSYNRGYAYTIGGLSAGNYVIIAGTDRDSDLEICDAGEACGFYPVYGSFIPVEVGEGTAVSGIDFQVIDNVSQGPGSLGIMKTVVRSNDLPMAF